MTAVTKAELDDLPDGAIILTNPPPMCWVKIGPDTIKFGGEWRTPYKVPGANGEFRDSTYVARVATRILYDPRWPAGTIDGHTNVPSITTLT